MRAIEAELQDERSKAGALERANRYINAEEDFGIRYSPSFYILADACTNSESKKTIC